MSRRNQEEDRRIGERMRRRRECLGLSQRQAATELSITAQHLGRIESGKATLTGSRVLEICAGLDLSPNALFGYEALAKTE